MTFVPRYVVPIPLSFTVHKITNGCTGYSVNVIKFVKKNEVLSVMTSRIYSQWRLKVKNTYFSNSFNIIIYYLYYKLYINFQCGLMIGIFPEKWSKFRISLTKFNYLISHKHIVHHIKNYTLK